MTAIEKAKELVDKFYQEAPLDEIKFYSNDVMAKSCALIAVDEIYKLKLIIGQHLEDIENKENYYSYWEEVKHEINKI
jgi:hypothetical protein